MVALDLNKYRSIFIVGLIALFSLFALWLRLLPMINMGNTDILSMVASDDPLFNLRQVEQMLANDLGYAWFDPMTLYPGGSGIYWGPLFPLIIALGCVITGAATRSEITGIALLVPPLMGVATVIVMYYVGKACGDWKTGLLASGFTAIVSGQFFSRSLFGYIDHHIAEVLFSTIFCLFYIYTILSEKDGQIRLNDLSTYKKTAFFAAITGIAYLLGLFTMPTMILFALIAGIFTVIQFIIDAYRGRTSEYLLITNCGVFFIAIVGLLLFGIKHAGLGLSLYSVGHIYAYAGLIGGTILLYLIAGYLKDKPKTYYPLTLAGCGIVFAGVLFILSSDLFNLLVVELFAFFGQAPITQTVQEARGWTTADAWRSFGYGLFLMLGGIIVMIYNNIKEEHPHQVFALVWSLVILFSTWQHIRYEYYLAINIALLSAVCVSFCMVWGWPAISGYLGNSDALGTSSNSADTNRKEEPKGKRQKRTKKQAVASVDTPVASILLVVIAVVLSLLFIQGSFSYSYGNADDNGFLMNQDWRESLEWMEGNTPETGVDYLRIYDQKTYVAPAGSYGIMSWWDYGHLITYIAKRIPNANPFQQGVAGTNGAAAYFMSRSEDTANAILDTLGTRYIITDIEMDSGKFWAMATWFNASAAIDPYQMTILVPREGSQSEYQSTQLNNQQYYLTTISRLHNFDGSMTEPSTVYYIEYVDPSVSGFTLPVMTAAVEMNVSAAEQNVQAFNQKAPAGYHAIALSPSVVAPIDTVPALRHYRLVHESPTNVFNSPTIDLKYVKTFEYVRGAHIKGDGIIEVPVVTNTGRTFTYRQESINGEFIVPYSTTGNPYEVKTTGNYRIIGTDMQFEVPESAVIGGLTIQ